jgi:hypothetical protein
MIAFSLPPPRRMPVLRPGCTTTRSRPSNLEVELDQVTGHGHGSECIQFVGGSGVWTACVVVASFFGGSCANCHYGSEGAWSVISPSPGLVTAGRIRCPPQTTSLLDGTPFREAPPGTRTALRRLEISYKGIIYSSLRPVNDRHSIEVVSRQDVNHPRVEREKIYEGERR